MSGTSLDGLDVACCFFENKNDKWNYKIEAAKTYKYDETWSRKLSNLHLSSAHEITLENTEYGYFIGETVNHFISENNLKNADLIASHGHTIFHQPEKNFTYQLGSGAAIAGKTGITTVCDFRSLDMALNGQGAPLVPIGDALLFSEYDYCLNLGGIANISFDDQNKRIAFDICPANMVLNKLANDLGKQFDDEGTMARSGSLNNKLINTLNSLDFYKSVGAKSLGREWIEETFFPQLNQFNCSVKDKLKTICEHIAVQVSAVIKKENARMIITGGGAYNTYLVECIKKHTSAEVIIPEKQIVEYKEALIFAFLGLLRMEEEENTLASVTGAEANSIGGCVYLGKGL